MRLLKELLPHLCVDLTSSVSDLRALFGGHASSCWLEIGFGSGGHLVRTAAENPNVGFIGCEPFVNGMAKALAAIEAQGLTNIRLFEGDAADLLAWLPEASVGRVFLLFPDPWPKRRHRKRRFISDQRLAALARVMQPGAELRFATDIDDYAGWTLARILRSPQFLWAAEQKASWMTPWAGWRETRYEAKAKRAGGRPIYLTFIRR
ncbi:MAG TPA: tRNA (guanosine(46)-N7)-methyltransferase TrmB [Beijerinckiaceae bacterium]|jgi:tRNA (guanine-N7-)-methyltransferase|nr:tRNA (guanosine(46)-N7)-methyltransferase TrmB [Beijerinckiaceae bacterium]